VAVVGYQTNVVSVFRNIGVAGTQLRRAHEFPHQRGALPSTVLAGDLDGDGKPDLVVVNNNGSSSSVSILRNLNTQRCWPLRPVDSDSQCQRGSPGGPGRRRAAGFGVVAGERHALSGLAELEHAGGDQQAAHSCNCLTLLTAPNPGQMAIGDVSG